MLSSRSQTRGRAARRLAVPLVLVSLALAACGSDEDEAADTTAATSVVETTPATDAPADTTAETDAPADTTAETDGPADTTMETDGPADTTMETTAETDATGATGGEFASMDEIAAMCPADSAPDKLVFTTFPGQMAQLDSMTENFTAATGVDIEWLENGLGDRLTKMNAEKGSPTIDVALVPVGEAPALLTNGVTEATNTDLPNYEQLIDPAKIDGGYGISVLQFGIAYNPEFVTTPPTSWEDLLDEQYAGHIALPAMPNSGGYALLTMLSTIAGGDETDLSAAIEQVAGFKGSVHSFIGSSTTVEEQIKSGEIWMYVDIGGVATGAKLKRDVPVEFVVPSEGSPVSVNTLVIPAGSDHLGCSEAFVAYLLGEESQTAWAETLFYGSSSSIIDFPEELNASLFPAPGATDIVPLDWSVVAANSADTLDLWNREVVS